MLLQKIRVLIHLFRAQEFDSSFVSFVLSHVEYDLRTIIGCVILLSKYFHTNDTIMPFMLVAVNRFGNRVDIESLGLDRETTIKERAEALTEKAVALQKFAPITSDKEFSKLVDDYIADFMSRED